MLLRKLVPSAGASSRILQSSLLLAALAALPVQAGDVLQTNGFSTCMDSTTIVVNKLDISYNKNTNFVTMDVEGVSEEEQKIMLGLEIQAYGRSVYSKSFDPCDENFAALCPLPKGSFYAIQNLTVPGNYANMVPSIAFQIPNLDGIAYLTIKSKDGGDELACLQSSVTNGQTASQTSVKYATAGIAAAALAVSGASGMGAAGAGAGAGAAGPSPNFGDVMGWFGFLAMNGMSSVSYPSVYRAFTDNFAWSTGIISWEAMQKSIDNFRKSTGGNLTDSSIEYLLNNVTLVYDSSSSSSSNSTSNSTSTSSKHRRALDNYMGDIFARGIGVGGASGNTSAAGNSTGTESSKVMQYVKGIQAKVETLKVPSANTFMTVLEIFCIVIAAIAVCILLFKVILEVWALFASFPQGLTGFRKRYWSFLATTIVRIVLILYGTWTLYCLYQFSHGDSWGAHVLAGITLGIFTALLGFFAWKIWALAKESQKKMPEKGSAELFENKSYMRRYGIFYDAYSANFWWMFVPLIIYAFAKGALIALGDGHGMVQTVGQTVIELLLLVLLLWNRPYNTKAGNVLNILIAVVRVLSVVCLIVFVDELGIAQDTKTVTGVALIVIQSVLTGALAIMIVVNAIINMVKENPHRKRRKMLEKMGEADLTPLDARNSMLTGNFASDPKGNYQKAPGNEFYYNETPLPLHSMTPAPEHQTSSMHYRNESSHNLMETASPMAESHDHHALRNSLSYEDYRNHEPVSQAHAY